jgi:hypothetical protein
LLIAYLSFLGGQWFMYHPLEQNDIIGSPLFSLFLNIKECKPFSSSCKKTDKFNQVVLLANL